MKILKGLFILVLGSCFTFLVFDYTLGKKEIIEPKLSSDVIEPSEANFGEAQLVAMQSASTSTKSTDFYENTYQVKPDSSGARILKRGKRFYNSELIEQVSTSANLETFSRIK